MTHLIFALGNPSKEYNFTRHNFGFLSLDFYAKLNQLTFTEKPKFHAQLAQKDDTLFAKPTTYYNLVGQSLQSIIKFYKIPLSNVLIICDDFTLPFGTIRLRQQGTAGGNNGLKSIIETLGTTDFPRLRLGTDSPARATLGDTDFVLSRFTPEEKAKLPDLLTQITHQITTFTS